MWDDLSKEARRDFIQGGTASLAEGVKHRNVVCIAEIKYELLKQDVGAMSKGNNLESRRLANIMNYMPGWERTGRPVRFKEYGVQKAYARSGNAVLD